MARHAGALRAVPPEPIMDPSTACKTRLTPPGRPPPTKIDATGKRCQPWPTTTCCRAPARSSSPAARTSPLMLRKRTASVATDRTLLAPAHRARAWWRGLCADPADRAERPACASSEADRLRGRCRASGEVAAGDHRPGHRSGQRGKNRYCPPTRNWPACRCAGGPEADVLPQPLTLAADRPGAIAKATRAMASRCPARPPSTRRRPQAGVRQLTCPTRPGLIPSTSGCPRTGDAGAARACGCLLQKTVLRNKP